MRRTNARIGVLVSAGLAIILLGGPLQLSAGQPPASPIFYRTLNSDEWVNHTFHVQSRYARVLVVDASDHPPHGIRVASLSLNAEKLHGENVDEKDAPRAVPRYTVAGVFKTLQEAADAARGGDLIAVMP